MIKPLTIILNLLVIGTTISLIIDEGFPGEPLFFSWIILVTISPIFNLILISGLNNKDNLLSLWVEVRKKKLKDELQK